MRLILILLTLVGCETTDRRSAAQSSATRPVYVEVYNLEGAASAVEKRRFHAYSRIKERCQPHAFQIIGETRRDPTRPAEQPVGTAKTEDLAYVQYNCFEKN